MGAPLSELLSLMGQAFTVALLLGVAAGLWLNR